MTSRAHGERPQLNVSSLGIFNALAALAKNDRPTGVLEFARQLEVPISTAHRALATLERCDFVTKDEGSRKYQLGNAARRVTSAFFNMFPIRGASMLTLRRLALLTGQTAALWVRVDSRMVRIAAIEGTQEIVDRRSIGDWLPIGQCAPGWAVIAANACPGSKPTRRLNDLLASLRTTGFVSGRSPDCNEYAAAITPPKGHVFASIAIEGGTQTGFHSYKSEARKIIELLERDLSSNPQAACDPFAHLA